jgi:hypothetical protein
MGVGDLLPRYLRSMTLYPKGSWTDDYWTLAIEVTFHAVIFGVLRVGLLSAISRVAAILTSISAFFVSILAARHWHLLESSLGDVADRRRFSRRMDVFSHSAFGCGFRRQGR